jgi:hypothetical protein
MREFLFVLLDVGLLFFATLRVTRLVTTDALGQWWLYGPLYRRYVADRRDRASKRAKYIEGLSCPFCVGFWIGVVGIASLLFAGGPGDAALWWRVLAAPFALNWIVGHVANRLD